MSAFFDYAGFSLQEALRLSPAEQRFDELPANILTSPRELRVRIECTRSAIATSLGLPPQQLLLSMGTTRGFKQLLLHADWFPDRGEVVISDLMYPKMFRALSVRCRGVVVAPVSTLDDAASAVACIASKVGAETSAVVVDVVDNRRGLSLDLAGLRAAVRERNPACLIVLDASQAYGQLPQLADAAAHYDMLLADLKKWCGYKTQTGLGFIAVPGRAHMASLVETTNSQFALHPDWLPAPVYEMDAHGSASHIGDSLALVGRADAGGADLLSWCSAASFVEEVMAELRAPNRLKAGAFLERIAALDGPWRCWPAAPSRDMTGIVSLVGDVSTLAPVHRALLEQEIACSLIPTNLPPQPAALDRSEACLRFSFHDRLTTDDEIETLLNVLAHYTRR